MLVLRMTRHGAKKRPFYHNEMAVLLKRLVLITRCWRAIMRSA
jgi:hypothetical protein